ncbi:GAF domain-containing protein [Mycobacterium sp. PSTR-4-N]|uniref:GAF domain-containing protein n=1 Tax=Mycobacterium sp. PSTR-4-N TaxID=2917745 RepID=UPI001F150365|nr:GAF domain-containing protein [Mycobacterium sp. PSTR-4-N]MCG7597633.1 GAF domain-containing protein [Mycobacterium sp. PSTR-4-N]
MRTGLMRSRTPAPSVAPMPSPMMALLRAVARDGARLLPKTTGCGITLMATDGRRITSAGSDHVAERLTALHDQHPHNPCASAWAHRGVRRTQSSVTRAAWAGWMTHARQQGVRSVLAASLCVGDRRLGTVLFYSTTNRAFRHEHDETLSAFADAIAIGIDHCQNGPSPAG